VLLVIRAPIERSLGNSAGELAGHRPSTPDALSQLNNRESDLVTLVAQCQTDSQWYDSAGRIPAWLDAQYQVARERWQA